jgi:uncharacterized repeat protein (TIGR01451 family)
VNYTDYDQPKDGITPPLELSADMSSTSKVKVTKDTANKKITWEISNVRYGTSFTAVESGYNISLYEETTNVTVKGEGITDAATSPEENPTTASFTVPANDKSTVEFKNIYENTPPEKIVYTGSVEHKIDGKTVQPDDILTYQITYKNTSDGIVTAVIKDTIPGSTTIVERSIQGGDKFEYDELNREIKWTSVLDPEESMTVSFQVKVKEDTNIELTNTAKVIDDNNTQGVDTEPVKNSKPVKYVFAEDDTTMEPENTIDNQTVKADDVLTYKLVYKNVSNEVQNVGFEDTIPNNAEYVDKSASPSAALENGKLIWEAQPVDPGQTIFVTFQVKVKKNNGVRIDNTGYAVLGENRYRTNETKNPVPKDPEKTVYSSQQQTFVDGKPVKPGDILTYSIKYENTTADEVNATITDKIPDHTEYVDGSAAGTGGSYTETQTETQIERKITWNKTVSPGSSVTVEFQVRVIADNGVDIKNKAVIDYGNNHYESNETVNSKPVKDVFSSEDTTVTIDKKLVKKDDELVYKLTYTNTMPEAEDGSNDQVVVFTDTLPSKDTIEFIEASDNGEYDTASNSITWPEVTLKPGATKTVTFKIKVKANTGIALDNQGTAIVDGTEFKTNITHNPVPKDPEKTVFSTKQQIFVDDKEVKPGDTLTYTITYKNTTGEAAKVDITDTIPANTQLVKDSAIVVNGQPADNIDESGITWTFNEMADNAEVTVSFQVTVNDNVSGETLKNKAIVIQGENTYDSNEVVSHTPPVKTVYNAEDETTEIDTEAVKPGDTLTYNIVYKNSNETATKVDFEDVIPAYTTYVDGSAGIDGATADISTTADEDGKVTKLTWANVEVPGNNGSVTIKFQVTVDKSSNVIGQEVRNEATARVGNNTLHTNPVTNPIQVELELKKNKQTYIKNDADKVSFGINDVC